eukprot:5039712-Prymnesium_polylepis.1
MLLLPSGVSSSGRGARTGFKDFCCQKLNEMERLILNVVANASTNWLTPPTGNDDLPPPSAVDSARLSSMIPRTQTGSSLDVL